MLSDGGDPLPGRKLFHPPPREIKGSVMRFFAGKDIIGLLLIAVFIFLATASSPCAAGLDDFKSLKGSLLIAGGTAHLPVMHELARRIHESNPQINISVSGGGSSLGVEKVGRDLVDIGNSGRPLTAQEAAAYKLTAIPFAIDGIAVVVHPFNRVASLSMEEARQIFAGKIRNWREVGGEDREIHLYGRDAASGTRNVFRKKMFGQEEFAADTRLVDSNNAMKVIVSLDPLAIGYVSIGHLDAAKVKGVPLDGVVPNQANARNGTYMISRKLFMCISETPSELTRLFVDYVLGSDGHGAIVAAGYIPLQ